MVKKNWESPKLNILNISGTELKASKFNGAISMTQLKGKDSSDESSDGSGGSSSSGCNVKSGKDKF